jgi:hypothetical protein
MNSLVRLFYGRRPEGEEESENRIEEVDLFDTQPCFSDLLDRVRESFHRDITIGKV